MKNLERLVVGGAIVVASLLSGCYKENSVDLYRGQKLRTVESYLMPGEKFVKVRWMNTHINE